MARIVNDDDQEIAQQRLLTKHKVAKPSAQDVRTSRVEVVEYAEWGDDLFNNPLLYKDPFD